MKQISGDVALVLCTNSQHSKNTHDPGGVYKAEADSAVLLVWSLLRTGPLSTLQCPENEHQMSSIPAWRGAENRMTAPDGA
jgi:hypothetical protein